MLKKLLLTAVVAISAATSQIVLADSAPYLGMSVGERTNTSESDSNNFRGLTGSLFGGYGATISQTFYLGGEIFADLGSSTIKDHNLKSTYGYGIDFIPGVMVTEHTMAYLRAGIGRTRFSDFKTTGTGGRIGLGMQTNLAQNWDLRGDYVYSSYGKISGTTTKPRSDQFNLGLVYKFQ